MTAIHMDITADPSAAVAALKKIEAGVDSLIAKLRTLEDLQQRVVKDG